jgi:hypothetical protein
MREKERERRREREGERDCTHPTKNDRFGSGFRFS